MVYIGIDAHVKRTYYCVMDSQGCVLIHRWFHTTKENFRELIQEYQSKKEEVHVAIETSGITRWIAHELEKAGADVYVVNAYQLKLIAHSKRKRDRYDSKVLADLLRCDGLPHRVYIPPKKTEQMRELVRLRKTFVRLRSQATVKAKSWMRLNGYDVGSRDFRSDLSWNKVNGTKTPFYLCRLREIYRLSNTQVDMVEKKMGAVIPNTDPQLKQLVSIPGVGMQVARTLLAAIGDVGRFSKSSQLVSYAGLHPSERSSGERELKGRITKQGRSELRDVMVQAAWGVLRSRKVESQPLKQFFYRIMHKRCSQVAAVALARKLLVIAYQLLKTSSFFDAHYLSGKTT